MWRESSLLRELRRGRVSAGERCVMMRAMRYDEAVVWSSSVYCCYVEGYGRWVEGRRVSGASRARELHGVGASDGGRGVADEDI